MNKTFVDKTKIKWGYENIILECPFCKKENIINRKSDLKTVKLIIEEHKRKCQNCGDEFYFKGDVGNANYEQIIYKCYNLFELKEYMQVILNCCQAYEMFFDHFVKIQLLAKTYQIGYLSKLNNLYKNLYDKTKKFPFDKMRALFFVVYKKSPKNLNEAEQIINNICNPQLPKKATINDIKWVHGTKINEKRNEIIHKKGYRPTKQEAEKYFEEAKKLIKIGYNLNIHRDFEYYENQP